jgi:hypothetical protein
MNISLVIFLVIYLGLILYYFYILYLNNFKFKGSFKIIKGHFKKIFKCCIDEKKIIKIVGEEKASKISKEFEEIENCAEPAGFPLDVCLTGKFSKEEISIREKVLKTLSRKEAYVFDGGKNKLIIPLEATLFLSKNLNPLVTEDGEIIVHIKETDEDEKLVIEVAGTDEVLYKDSDSLIDFINTEGKEEVKEEGKEEVKEEVKKIDIEEVNFDLNKQEPKIIEKETIIEIDENPFENDLDNLDDFSDEESDADINDLLMKELDELEFELDDDVSSEGKEFYLNKNYETYTEKKLDFTKIVDSLDNLLEKEEVIKKILKNTVKAEPIAFNANKTNVYLDQKILFFAISKLYGMEYKIIIENFAKINKKELLNIDKVISKSFNPYLSDLFTKNKNGSLYILSNKDNDLFKGFGYVLETSVYKMCLSDEDFDYFKSFPYNNSYTLLRKANSDDFKNPTFIFDIKSVEIK